MDDSIYAPLFRESHTIRLLELQPAKWGDAIKAKLQECPLAEAHDRYTTISYTWGNPGTIKHLMIKCNGKRVPISENLYTILRRLRQPNHAVLVWADALCINQTDTAERTHQVGLMGEIYRNSRETVIWLGEQTATDDCGERFLSTCVSPDDWSSLREGGPPRISWQGNESDKNLLDAYLLDYKQLNDDGRRTSRFHDLRDADTSNDIFGAFCLIQSFAQGTSNSALKSMEEDESHMWQRYDYPKAWYSLISADAHIRGSRSARVWAGLERLMNRPWWNRIWVIQETVLSRKATIQFGMLSAPWVMFADAASHHARERRALCLDLGGTFRGQSLLGLFSDAVLQIDDTRRQHQVASDNTKLLSLLWKFRPLEASDKRDKVFALLGLTTDWESRAPVTPDYSIDADMTFLRAATSSILRSRSLLVLAGDLEATLARKRTQGLSSWVMDWSLPCLSLEVERVNSLSMHNASGGRTGEVRLHEKDWVLEVQGVYVDEVVAVGEVSRHTQINDTNAVIREWNLLMRKCERQLGSYPTGEAYDDAFWRTLVANLVHVDTVSDHQERGANSYRRATPEDATAFEAWRMWSRCISRDTLSRTATFTERDLHEGISSIHYALRTATASRRFFLTRSGYMGIGPKLTSPDDRLYVFKNSNVPFLIRQDRMSDCAGTRLKTLIEEDGCKESSDVCHETHKCYQLVGDCFTYGLMDGEAFERRGADVKRLYLS